MRAILILALCLAAVAAVPSNPQRILGGSLTTIDQYPAIATLLYSWNLSYYRQACGGTIINNRSILTAAHCTYRDPASRWRARVGSSWANSGGSVYNTARIINHPSYNSATSDGDLSILRTASNIVFDNNAVQPASIPGVNYSLGDNQVIWAAGWGTSSQSGSDSDLRHVQILTVNQQTCAQRYRSVGQIITPNMLCSGWLDVDGRDQCLGDSGSPLFHNNVVVGVYSFGRGCAQAFFPGINVRVHRFSSWIVTNA